MLRSGDVKVWVHDVATLPQVLRTMRSSPEASRAVEALYMFSSNLLDRIDAAGHKRDNLNVIAYELRNAGERSLANKSQPHERRCINAEAHHNAGVDAARRRRRVLLRLRR